MIERIFRKGNDIYITHILDHFGRRDRLTTLYIEKEAGPLPDNIQIENEEDTTQEGTKASEKNTIEAHKQQEKEGGTRR